ncbi:SRPBCC domain-containing protein [Cerasicoccus frondis]|uniref:SRPBCC domain-containing protein n=1 Tax=Cerasicoccus frondis TaxID=490090 RepID=UPI002852D89B|nr:SRPBCC domain-containing protein [Cerasicoccus frondis]
MTTILEATDNTLKMQRTFKASIDRVWAAWTDQNQVFRWFGCPDSKGLGASIDLQVGGVYSVTLFTHGKEMTMDGKILELDAPNRIKLGWRWVGDAEMEQLPQTEILIEMSAVSEGTLVKLTHTGFPNVDVCNEHQKGWSASLERVEGFVSSAEAEIFAAVAEWDIAVGMKDSAGIVEDYVEEATLFDIGTQVDGVDGIKALWEQCFPFFGDKITIQRRKVSVRIMGESALLTCQSRCQGVLLPEGQEESDMMKSWFRTSAVFQRIDGRWKVVHEHISMPMDCMEKKPAYILD